MVQVRGDVLTRGSVALNLGRSVCGRRRGDVLELPIPGEPVKRKTPLRESGIQFSRTQIIPLRNPVSSTKRNPGTVAERVNRTKLRLTLAT